MNYSKRNKKVLIRKFLKVAHKRLRSSKACIDVGSFEDSISRSYYAVLDAVTAMLIIRDIVPKSHEGAIRYFALHFVRPGTVPREYQRNLSKLEKARLEADYAHEREFSKEDTERYLLMAEEFVKMAEELVERELEG